MALTAVISSCSLDQYPHIDTTAKDVYQTADNYEAVLSGIYTSMIVNLSGIADDDRLQNYTRALIMFQEATTDNMDNVWAAGESTTDLNNLSWTASDSWISAIYYHIFNIVSLSNELIRNASDKDLERFSDAEKERIVKYRNEARGLRALAYYHALDFFPAVSFVNEDSEVGSYIPPMYDRKQLFAYIESELKALETALPSVNYGHFTSGAASALLARLYLNAEVYIGEPRYDECIKACQNVFAGGYSLEDDYFKLFNADNHRRTNEILFALSSDATHTTAWGAGTYLVCATRFDKDAGMLEDFGVSSYWNCLRARPELVDRFETGDLRGRFGSRNRILYSNEDDEGYYTVDGDTKYKYQDRPKEIIGHDETTSGYLINKWSNKTDDGETSSDTAVNGADTDFPMFRLAEVNLTFAEAVLRGGSGASRADALAKVNDVRRRAFGGVAGEISDADLTLDFILDERSRELYTEGCRRTDLIRFDRYTSGFNWNWKGGVAEGKDVDAKFRYLPIPEAELSANPSFKEINSRYGF